MSDRTPIVSISDSNQGHEGQNIHVHIRTVDVTFFLLFFEVLMNIIILGTKKK